MSKKYFLKPNTIAEPLIWRWYAWPYLIPPATAACNIVDRHLKIMQSYVQNPQIHAQAIKDPRMLGGPFIDLEGQKVNEVKALINETKISCATLIELNNALKEADKLLQSQAKGGSLAVFYQKLPSILRGLVELVYDLNSHPSIRFIEPLIYKLYYKNIHQEIVLSEISNDYRKFILSTPRFEKEREIYLKLPFSDSRIDTLFKMRTESRNLEDIKALFDIPVSKHKLFESFFTRTPPCLSADRNYTGDKVRIRYLGHACVLIQAKGISILFDPVISYPIEGEDVQKIPRFTLYDLPDYIDYVVITHNHQDHIMFETLLQLRHKIGHIVCPVNLKGSLADPSIKLILENIGFTSLIELTEVQNLLIKNAEITAFPFLGEHSDLNIQSKLSYYININGRKLFFAADSNNLDEYLYHHIFNMIGPVDVLFLGMECEGAPLTWLYGPLLSNPLSREFDNERTLSGSNFDKAWSIAEKLRCKQAYVYAMGQEPWLNYVMALSYSPDSNQIKQSNKFISQCVENQIISERLFGKKEIIL